MLPSHFVFHAHFLTCEANLLIVMLCYAGHTLWVEKATIVYTRLVSRHGLDRWIRRRVVLIQRTGYDTISIPHWIHAFSLIVVRHGNLIHIFSNQVRVFERGSFRWLFDWWFWGGSLLGNLLLVSSDLRTQLVSFDVPLSCDTQVELWFSC